jgi:hypothetical protein
VINGTLTTVDAIAALPVFNFGQAFSTLPLRNYTQAGLPADGRLVGQDPDAGGQPRHRLAPRRCPS